MRIIILSLGFIMCIAIAGIAQSHVTTSEAKTKVLVLKIHKDIDTRSVKIAQSALQTVENDLDYVVLDINTFGGSVSDAYEIRTMVLNYEKPIYAFINPNAASSGALIALACDSIYMHRNATFGAVTVVKDDCEKAHDKYQSYMRSIMRSTAEAGQRNIRIAEAMVDEDIEIEGIVERGKIITFTTSEAIKHGYCEAEVNSIEELLERVGIEDYEIVQYQLSLGEEIKFFFARPIVTLVFVLAILSIMVGSIIYGVTSFLRNTFEGRKKVTS